METRKEKLKIYIQSLINKTVNAVYENDTKSWLFDFEVSERITVTDGLCEELLSSTLSLLQALYGAQSPQPLQFYSRFNFFTENATDWCQYNHYRVLDTCHGKLKSMLSDIDYGLIDNLEAQISAEIFNDFLSLAHTALEEKYVGVAAVIGAVALDDTLKKISHMHGGVTENQDMSGSANYLKSKGILKGTTGKQIERYIVLRNKALHAEWDKLEAPDVAGLLGFTEQLIRVHLSEN